MEARVRFLLRSLLPLGAACAAVLVLSQAASGLAPSEVVRRFLIQDCRAPGKHSTPELNRQVVGLGPAALPQLWTALRFGPPDSLRHAVDLDAAADFHHLHAFVAGGGLDSLHQGEVRDSVLAVGPGIYVEWRRRALVIPYHVRALRAVVEIHPPSLRDSLESIRDEPSLPIEVKKVVQEVLTHL